MKIKVLVVPTLIIVSGFLALNHLKPDLDTYLQKRALRDEAKKNAEQAATLASNVKALRAEMDTQKPKVDFLKRYFPDNKDQGRMFDSLNFLTIENGLVTIKITVADVKEEEVDAAAQTFGTLDPVTDADPLAPLATGAPSQTSGLLAPYKAPTPKKYAISFEALGSYGNIKELLKKLSSLDRFQELQSFKIATGLGTPAEEGAPAPGSTLTLTYNTVLPYQALPAPLAGEAIVNIPDLHQANFDFTSIDTLQAAATAVPDIVLGTEGKGNPFE